MAQTEKGRTRLEHVKERLDRSAAKVGEDIVEHAAAEDAGDKPEGELMVPQFPRLEELHRETGAPGPPSIGEAPRENGAPSFPSIRRAPPASRLDEGVRGARRVLAEELGHGETP